MARRAVSNPLALAVLSCLWERPMYPYEITTTLRERGKDRSIRLNFGSLYGVIRALEEHGFVVESHAEREGNRPERRVYRITEAGRAETHAWLSELLATPDPEHPALEAALSLIMILPPQEALQLLRDRVQRLDSQLAEEERVIQAVGAAGLPEVLIIESAFHIAMMRAERDWVSELVGRLERAEVGGQQLWVEAHEALAAGADPSEIEHRLAEAIGQEAIDAAKEVNALT